jgi:hypothetical protein
VIKDEQPPAPVITADIRTGLVYGATSLPVLVLVTEKWAAFGKFFKNTRIQKKVPLVGINTDGSFLAGVNIMY